LGLNRFYTYLFLALAGAAVISSCSRKKNTLTSRTFHNTSANYNGFFYAKESIKKGEDKIAAGKDLDWEELLPIFIIPTEDEAKRVYPEMDRAIEKLSKVIDYHSIKIKGKEYNKWVDDSYMLIGVSHFYKRKFTEAEKTLKFVTETFTEPKQADTRLAAKTWLALTYMEQEKLGNARNVFLSVDNKLLKQNPKKNRWKYHSAYALYYQKRGAYSSAVSEMQKAIANSTTKKQKARFYFIIGQLFEQEGNSKKAIENYQMANKLARTNEMRFYSTLRQALAADQTVGFDQVRELLYELLAEDKYDIYQDQVYWALATSYFKENEDSIAIEYLKQSVAVSQGNKRQKIKSFRKLADWHFEERIYRPASKYYDSTLVYLPQDHEEYSILEVRSNTLKELVEYLDVVSHQDSIQRIAKMDPDERDKFLMDLVRRFEKEEEERRIKEQMEAAIAARKAGGNQFAAKGGQWYFYNQGTVASGRGDFARVWGDRENEDFWRVQSIYPQQGFDDDLSDDKKMVEGGEGKEELSDLEKALSGIEKPVQTKGRTPSFDELLAGLPLNDTLLDTSNVRLQEALYKSGILYKEYLNDDDYAVESFTGVVERFEDGEYFLPSHYQLYRLFLKKEQAGSYFTTNFQNTSSWWKDIILTDYPDTEYAYLILNPNAKEESERIRLAELERYEEVYKDFKRRHYRPLIEEIKFIIDNEPDNHLIHKYYLLRALCIGYVAHPSTAPLEDKLVEIVSLFPGSEEAASAQRLIALINQSESGSPFNQPEEDKLAYKFKEKEMHYFALMVPPEEKDINNLKFKLSDFNMSYFKSANLKVSVNFITKQDQIVMVKSFATATQAKEYLESFNANTDKVKFIREKGYQYFLISKPNYSNLFRNKDIDEYISFFNKAYK
jgi:hypothetical protein